MRNGIMANAISVTEVFELCVSTLTKCGASRRHAAAIGDMLTAAEKDNAKSHGLFRLPSFLEGCLNGLVDVKAVPEVVDVSASVVRVNGRGGFQPAAHEAGLPLLIEKAKRTGIAMLGVTNTRGMSGAMWWPAEQVAQHGLITIVMSNSPQYMGYYGSGTAERVFGTNPMAFAWPRSGKRPMVWDQAASVMARGEIMLAEREGKQLPEGVGVDAHGQPSTDPTQVLEGAQLPFGAYKGCNIALMVELLSAALIGTDLAIENPPDAPFDACNRGLFILAIDPRPMRDTNGGETANDSQERESAAERHAETLFQKIMEQPGARLPADRRYQHREIVETTGKLIDVNPQLMQRIQHLADSAPQR